jgi:hypothetical protein
MTLSPTTAAVVAAAAVVVRHCIVVATATAAAAAAAAAAVRFHIAATRCFSVRKTRISETPATTRRETDSELRLTPPGKIRNRNKE